MVELLLVRARYHGFKALTIMTGLFDAEPDTGPEVQWLQMRCRCARHFVRTSRLKHAGDDLSTLLDVPEVRGPKPLSICPQHLSCVVRPRQIDSRQEDEYGVHLYLPDRLLPSGTGGRTT